MSHWRIGKETIFLPPCSPNRCRNEIVKRGKRWNLGLAATNSLCKWNWLNSLSLLPTQPLSVLSGPSCQASSPGSIPAMCVCSTSSPDLGLPGNWDSTRILLIMCRKALHIALQIYCSKPFFKWPGVACSESHLTKISSWGTQNLIRSM